MPVARGIRLGAFGLTSGSATGLAVGLVDLAGMCTIGSGAGTGVATSVMLNSIGSIYSNYLFLTVFNSASKAYIDEAKFALG